MFIQIGFNYFIVFHKCVLIGYSILLILFFCTDSSIFYSSYKFIFRFIPSNFKLFLNRSLLSSFLIMVKYMFCNGFPYLYFCIFLSMLLYQYYNIYSFFNGWCIIIFYSFVIFLLFLHAFYYFLYILLFDIPFLAIF